MTIVLASYIVRNNNGSINQEATLERFATDLLKYEAERETENTTIGVAIHALFDAHLGKRLASPFVVGEALKSLNAQPDTYKLLTEKVMEYLRTNPDFSISKGKGGGVGRVADLPTKE